MKVGSYILNQLIERDKDYSIYEATHELKMTDNILIAIPMHIQKAILSNPQSLLQFQKEYFFLFSQMEPPDIHGQLPLALPQQIRKSNHLPPIKEIIRTNEYLIFIIQEQLVSKIPLKLYQENGFRNYLLEIYSIFDIYYQAQYNKEINVGRFYKTNQRTLLLDFNFLKKVDYAYSWPQRFGSAAYYLFYGKLPPLPLVFPNNIPVPLKQLITKLLEERIEWSSICQLPYFSKQVVNVLDLNISMTPYKINGPMRNKSPNQTPKNEMTLNKLQYSNTASRETAKNSTLNEWSRQSRLQNYQQTSFANRRNSKELDESSEQVLQTRIIKVGDTSFKDHFEKIKKSLSPMRNLNFQNSVTNQNQASNSFYVEQKRQVQSNLKVTYDMWRVRNNRQQQERSQEPSQNRQIVYDRFSFSLQSKDPKISNEQQHNSIQIQTIEQSEKKQRASIYIQTIDQSEKKHDDYGDSIRSCEPQKVQSIGNDLRRVIQTGNNQRQVNRKSFQSIDEAQEQRKNQIYEAKEVLYKRSIDLSEQRKRTSIDSSKQLQKKKKSLEMQQDIATQINYPPKKLSQKQHTFGLSSEENVPKQHTFGQSAEEIVDNIPEIFSSRKSSNEKIEEKTFYPVLLHKKQLSTEIKQMPNPQEVKRVKAQELRLPRSNNSSMSQSQIDQAQNISQNISQMSKKDNFEDLLIDDLDDLEQYTQPYKKAPIIQIKVSEPLETQFQVLNHQNPPQQQEAQKQNERTLEKKQSRESQNLTEKQELPMAKIVDQIKKDVNQSNLEVLQQEEKQNELNSNDLEREQKSSKSKKKKKKVKKQSPKEQVEELLDKDFAQTIFLYENQIKQDLF